MVHKAGLIGAVCLAASFICMGQEQAAILPASAVDDVKPVPVLSAGVAFVPTWDSGQPTLVSIISPVPLVPMGINFTFESRASFEGDFQRRNGNSGDFTGAINKSLDYMQLDYIGNRYVTITAGRFLTPFNIFNEREVCAVTPGDIERSGVCASPARQVALSASSLEEIFQGVLRIARELGLEERGKAVVGRERERLATVREKTARLPRPTVVMVEWTDPLFAMGNWGPELVEIANGELLLGKKGEHSAAIPAEQLRDADPEYLIVAPCGFNLERSLQEQTVLEQYPWWCELQAVRQGKVAFADGNLLFNRSGMTVSQTAEAIAEILHGVSFGERTEGVHWRRIKTPANGHSRPVRMSRAR